MLILEERQIEQEDKKIVYNLGQRIVSCLLNSSITKLICYF